MANESPSATGARAAGGQPMMFMVGAIGGFVLALASALEFLRFFKVALPGAAMMAVAVLMALGAIALGLGFWAVGKTHDNALAKVAGVLFVLFGVLCVTPLLGQASAAVAIYGIYGLFAIGALAFAAGGAAVAKSGEVWGKWSKIVYGGFFAVAAYQVFQLVTLLVRMNLPVNVIQIVSIAFLVAQVAGLGAAGLALWGMRESK
jgi:hypothetical protein